MKIQPQAPSEDAVWEDGKWLPLIDPRDSEPGRSPLINLDHPSPEFPGDSAKRVALYDALIAAAQRHLKLTGRHLNVYDEIAELFATIALGVKFNRSDEVGAEGRLGNDHYVVKCITPTNTSDAVTLKMADNFSHVAVVKITADFRITGRVITRKALPGSSEQMRKLRWSALPEAPVTRADR